MFPAEVEARHDKMVELVERMLDLRELDTRRGRS
jgi:hypothetical protein